MQAAVPVPCAVSTFPATASPASFSLSRPRMRRSTRPQRQFRVLRWCSTWANGRTSVSPFDIDLRCGTHPAVFDTNGTHHVVISTGGFDLIEAAPDSRRRFVNLFEDMLAALEIRFQIHVSSRIRSAADCTDPRLAEFLRQRVVDNPTFQRRVHIILSDAPPRIDLINARWSRLRGRRQAGAPNAVTVDPLRV